MTRITRRIRIEMRRERVARDRLGVIELRLQRRGHLALQLVVLRGGKNGTTHHVREQSKCVGQVFTRRLKSGEAAGHLQPRHLVGDLLPRQLVGSAAEHRGGELGLDRAAGQRFRTAPLEIGLHVDGVAAVLLRQ